MAKTKIVKFMCSIVLAVSLVLSQSYTAMASGSSTITEQQLGVLFDGMPYRCLHEMFLKFREHPKVCVNLQTDVR